MPVIEQQQSRVSLFDADVLEDFQNVCFRFRRIADDLSETIPNLESLILTGNNLQELGDIDPLAKLTQLTVLSLLTNPMASKKHYREYVIYK